MKKLESLVNLQFAMLRKESREQVLDKYLKYLNAYDNLENKGVKEKLEHREIFHRYLRYMDMAKE